MSKRLFDRDPGAGTTEYFAYNDADDTFTIETEYNADALVEANKRSFNDAGGNWKGDMHRVAQIPMPLYWELQEKGILDDQAAFKRWLNDPDNRFFRTRPGKV